MTDSVFKFWLWNEIIDTHKQAVIQTVNNKPYVTFIDRLVKEMEIEA